VISAELPVAAIIAPELAVCVDESSIDIGQLYNVLLVMNDDVGREYYEIHDPRWGPIDPTYGNQWLDRAAQPGVSSFAYPPIPALKDLALNGLICERFNVAAMCSPTRASTMTGRNNIDHGLGAAIQANAPDDPLTGDPVSFNGKTIFQLMEAQGSHYERILGGKWHITAHWKSSFLGLPDGEEKSSQCAQQPVTRGGATYYSGHLYNIGAVPGFEVEVPGHNHHNNWLHHVHDVRTPLPPIAAFSMQRGTGHSLSSYTLDVSTAMRDADLAGKPWISVMWQHLPHSPDERWDWYGGKALSGSNYHTYGIDGLAKADPSITAEYANGEDNLIQDPTDPEDLAYDGTIQMALRVKAMTEATDSSLAALVATARLSPRPTMIVFINDNGSPSAYQSHANNDRSIPSTTPYNSSHAKRGPWQGSIGSVCVVNGPAVASPGDGVTPRYWGGLTGIEDLFAAMCRWTGTEIPAEEPIYGTPALADGVSSVEAPGRSHYRQDAYINGYSADPFSEAQGPGLRFVSMQNQAGWKLLWVRAGSVPAPPLVTWQWTLFDMNTDNLEGNDLFYTAGPGDPVTDTIQEKYDGLTAAQREQFNDLYTQLVVDERIPPGLEVVLA